MKPKMFLLPGIMAMLINTSVAFAASNYHAVVLSAVYYYENGIGIIRPIVINNRSIFQSEILSPGNLNQYVLVINNSTGEIDIANKITGPIISLTVANPVMQVTAIDATVANGANTVNYVDASVTFLGDSGVAYSIIKRNNSGTLISDIITFNVNNGSGSITKGTVVTTAERLPF